MKNKTNNPLNIAIVGGGAAGFFAAITAKQQNKEAHVTIFEKGKKVLAKVEVSGGGRCNLTNSFAQIKDLKAAYPRGEKLLKRLFKSFDYEDAYQWFERHGVALTTQEDECVFPVSQSSQSVIQALTHEANRLGVTVLTQHQVTALEPQANGDIKLCLKEQKPRIFQRVAITTGGSPRAESLQYLARLEHEIVQPVPSLFTFNIEDKALRNLMGIVIEDATASIPGTKLRASGPLLITHWGVSGPAILKLSSYAARHVNENDYHFPLAINWMGNHKVAMVEEEISSMLVSHGKKQLGSIAPSPLTHRMWVYILEKTGLETTKRWDELGKKGLHKLVETLTNDLYQVSGKGAYKDEFVTCGGIALSNISLNTLESKVVPHLFFAGEVLDIDAITGGFNLQAAWTTGYVAGLHMACP